MNDPIKQFALVFGHAAVASTAPEEVEYAWSTPGHIISLLEEQSRASGASQFPDSSKHTSTNASQQSSRAQSPPPTTNNNPKARADKESVPPSKVHPTCKNPADGKATFPPPLKWTTTTNGLKPHLVNICSPSVLLEILSKWTPTKCH